MRTQQNQTVAPMFNVSVLVPIYNTPEHFLRQCLDSLFAQTLKKLEVVAIDDGSTNNVPQVLEEYARIHPEMQIVTKPNTGYGDSMNIGIQAARGEYIGICEPDDFANKHMFKGLFKVAKKHDCDIVKGSFRQHFDGGGRDRNAGILYRLNFKKLFSTSDDPRILLIQPSIWTAIYRKQMIIDNNIRFSPTPGASYQDASFGHQCWISSKRGMLVRNAGLHYRMDNAASSSKETGKVFAVCEEYKRSFEFMRRRGEDDLRTFGPILNVMRFGVYIWNYNRIASQFHQEFAEQWAREMQEALADDLVDLNVMPAEYQLMMYEMIENPAAFCDKYPNEIPQVPLL